MKLKLIKTAQKTCAGCIFQGEMLCPDEYDVWSKNEKVSVCEGKIFVVDNEEEVKTEV